MTESGPVTPYEDDFEPDSEIELSELQERVEALEERNIIVSRSASSAVYSLGATLAAILSWHSFHALLWALLAGGLSWIYVLYYVIANWSQLKLL
jgi:hypothetical protein